jgi:hypothetical protein
MSDTILGIYLVILCGLVVAWIFAFRAIFRQLRARHAERHAKLFGTPQRRKNAMDKFFSLLGFLAWENQAELRDGRLWLSCVFLKACTALFLLTFVAMMFTPFFLKEH